LNTRYVLIAVLVCGVLLSGWLLLQHSMTTGLPSISSQGPDLFVDNMNLKLINTDGALQYRVTADRMDHYPIDDRAELSHPVMQVFSADQPTWQIRSERGKIAAGYKTVWLLGAVEIHRMATPTTRPLAIFTRDLLIKPDKQTAETVNMARIRSDRFEVESVGLFADFISNRVELKSRVRGRFDNAG